MTRVLIAAVCALFIGAFVTEIHSRLFAGAYFPLLILVVAGIFIGSLITSRAARIATASVADEDAPVPAAASAGDDRESGRVKWFNRTKGFGFIIRDSGGEIFVHHRNILGSGRRSLRDGERVLFAVAPHDKGLQAERVSAQPDR
jgi:CspA family cold shock protein